MSVPRQFAVILCAHNGGMYIDEQLSSLSQQTRAPDFVEVHDWNSADNTVSRVSAWLDEVDHPDTCRLIEHDSSPGPTHSFIAASRIALNNNPSATHFMFCDQDDIWHGQRIERYERVLEESKRDIHLLFSDARVVDELGQLIHSSFYKHRRSPYTFPVDLESPDIALVNPALGFTLCLSRHLLELLLSHASAPWQMHDWGAVILCRVYGLDSLFLPEALADYRQHSNNLRGAPSMAGIRERVARLGSRMQYLSALNRWKAELHDSKATTASVIPKNKSAAILAVLQSRNLKLWYRLLLCSILLVIKVGVDSL
ncbi:hypothetical protein R0135_15530 [Congregibacter variabilis]|uniref:Glycosyltransferase 2-like domain-containing protein n=1 Tax=Congregibacter variabilis TaxID=3081200 RepID=A0ABZ0I2X5_9GAMM|nr:hypothetical protein R0135_15530 [Congregibacter sp. IMCC43200]